MSENKQKHKVTVIGGGTGTVAVLRGLKQEKSLELKVIVSMTDDGGSNAVVRDEFGILPLSDLRKSIIALADDEKSSKILRDLFTYRFSKGQGLSSHTLGNLIMMAMTDIYGGEMGAIAAAGELFDLLGEVIPVTYSDVRLVAKYSNGEIVTGEHLIDEPVASELIDSRIRELTLDGEAKVNGVAIEAILDADEIIIGPGDLYTSTLANIIVPEVSESIAESDARIILITNLMTKSGQTHWMKLSDFVTEVERYIGREADLILANSAEIDPAILAHYEQDGENPFIDDLEGNKRVHRADLILEEIVEKQAGDELKRSLLRHDSEKLAAVLVKIFYNKV